MSDTYPFPETLAQGFAKWLDPDDEADATEIAKEATYTNPNLHRRIQTDGTSEYLVGVFGTDSYRVTKTETYNDDDPDKPEIP